VHFRLHVSMPSTWLRWGQKQSLSHVPEEVILEEGVEGEGVEGEGIDILDELAFDDRARSRGPMGSMGRPLAGTSEVVQAKMKGATTTITYLSTSLPLYLSNYYYNLPA
jgi:hypothetical protein